MLLAVFEEINFTPFFAKKYGIGKLIKMTWILINNISKKKKNILKKYRQKCKIEWKLQNKMEDAVVIDAKIWKVNNSKNRHQQQDIWFN